MPDDNSSQDRLVDALVVRARTDREAFGQLYERHHGAIYRYCLRRLPDRVIAEDACAETFLAAAKKMPLFPGTTENDFKRWIYRMATHEIDAHWRRSARHGALLAAACQRGKLPSMVSENSEHLPDADELHHLRQAILQLGQRDQSLISLRYFEELPHEEIASILDMRAGAVRTALSRALRRLQRLLPVVTD